MLESFRMLIHRSMHPRCGFTMTELLLVVAVIAVILAITLPAAQTAFVKMRINKTQVDIVNVEAALEGYYSKNGRYPSASPANRVPVSALSEFMRFPKKQLISNVFYDPWKSPYYYAMPGTNHEDFADISSAGPDGQINANWQTDSTGVNADNIDNWSQKR